MLNKNQFVTMMSSIQELIEQTNVQSEVFNISEHPMDGPICDLIEVIAETIGDEHGDAGPDLFRFIYDFDFGNQYGDGYLFAIGNKEYRPTNFSEFYDVEVTERSKYE